MASWAYALNLLQACGARITRWSCPLKAQNELDCSYEHACFPHASWPLHDGSLLMYVPVCKLLVATWKPTEAAAGWRWDASGLMVGWPHEDDGNVKPLLARLECPYWLAARVVTPLSAARRSPLLADGDRCSLMRIAARRVPPLLAGWLPRMVTRFMRSCSQHLVCKDKLAVNLNQVDRRPHAQQSSRTPSGLCSLIDVA
ncbi:hypothetical protein Dimus_024399 [Dionaea muscipula]